MFQDNAPISFTLTHYTEFLESKGMTYVLHVKPLIQKSDIYSTLVGIVLVHGEVDTKDLVRL